MAPGLEHGQEILDRLSFCLSVVPVKTPYTQQSDKGKHCVAYSSEDGSIISMVESTVAPRGRGARGGLRVLDLNLQAVGREREPLGLVWASKTSKPTPMIYFLQHATPPRAKQFHSLMAKHSNAGANGQPSHSTPQPP